VKGGKANGRGKQDGKERRERGGKEVGGEVIAN
jgi:hypothetical protein